MNNKVRIITNKDATYLPVLIPDDIFKLIDENINVIDNVIDKINMLNPNNNTDKLKLELLLNNLRVNYDMTTIETLLLAIGKTVLINKRLFNYLLIKKQIDYNKTYMENLERINNNLVRFANTVITRFKHNEVISESSIIKTNISHLLDKSEFEKNTRIMPNSRIILINHYGTISDDITDNEFIEYAKILTYIYYLILKHKSSELIDGSNLDKKFKKLYKNYVDIFIDI